MIKPSLLSLLTIQHLSSNRKGLVSQIILKGHGLLVLKKEIAIKEGQAIKALRYRMKTMERRKSLFSQLMMMSLKVTIRLNKNLKKIKSILL